jgi:NitT/TauT family transport system ATP-binding protein
MTRSSLKETTTSSALQKTPSSRSPQSPADAATSTGSTSAIELHAVSKTFGDAGSVPSLRDIELEVAEAEFVAIVGASGCGKSTLLRIVGGLETATDGVVRVRHEDVRGPGPDRGVVFQDYGLFPWLSVRENIAYGPKQRRLPRAEVDEIADRFTEMVGLERVSAQFPSELSGGMQQRVAIARVLANDPAVLLMDEPFGALDSLTRLSMQTQLRQLCSDLGCTVLFVTHSVEEAVVLADRVVVMAGGPSHGTAGHIRTVVPVDLGFPRDITEPGFNEIKRVLLAEIFAEQSAQDVA